MSVCTLCAWKNKLRAGAGAQWQGQLSNDRYLLEQRPGQSWRLVPYVSQPSEEKKTLGPES